MLHLNLGWRFARGGVSLPPPSVASCQPFWGDDSTVVHTLCLLEWLFHVVASYLNTCICKL